MRDLIIQGDPKMKKLTLTKPAGDLPAGAVLEGLLEYFYPALDNNPSKLNKAFLLTDDTQELLGMPRDSDEYEGTVNLALRALHGIIQIGLTQITEQMQAVMAFMLSFKGVILSWSGSVATIPSGWALCDGKNGTPNLKDRFIVGAGGEYAVGGTGGVASNTLNIAQMPSHSHTISSSTLAGTAANHATQTAQTQSGTLTTGSTGEGAPIENRPPYYALCYIMKL